MFKCIYCNQPEDFNGKHVIPKFFGKFKPVNPVIIELACRKCNSEIFSKLEANFKEATDEGIFCQMLNLENCSSVRIRNKNALINFSLPFNDNFFQKMFPFLKYNF